MKDRPPTHASADRKKAYSTPQVECLDSVVALTATSCSFHDPDDCEDSDTFSGQNLLYDDDSPFDA